jgi:hypothetical protein
MVKYQAHWYDDYSESYKTEIFEGKSQLDCLHQWADKAGMSNWMKLKPKKK